MIEYNSPHDVDGTPLPKDRSVEAQRALKHSFNSWFAGNGDDRLKKCVRNVKILERPAILVELDSPASKDAFIKICEDEPTRLKGVLTGGRIKPRTYPVIFRFVLCDGSFNPYSLDHLRNLKNENGLEDNSIIAASWCKQPEKRAPNQATANLKVLCANPETGNLLLMQHICVEDHLVLVHRDLRHPVHCL